MNLKGRSMEKKKKPVGLIVVIVLLFVVAVAGWSAAVLGIIKSNEYLDAIIELQAKNEDLSNAIGDLSVVDDRYGNYIATENWEVKFAYTDGVTAVKAATGNKFDGSLYITSITKDGKTYDVRSCGEEKAGDFNDENPFFLGEVVRYSNIDEHAEGVKEPGSDDDTYSMITKMARYSYYVNRNIKNGCEENKDFKEGAKIARDIIDTIQMKD